MKCFIKNRPNLCLSAEGMTAHVDGCLAWLPRLSHAKHVIERDYRFCITIVQGQSIVARMLHQCHHFGAGGDGEGVCSGDVVSWSCAVMCDLCTVQEDKTLLHELRVCGRGVLQNLQGHLAEVKGLLGEPQEVTVASLEGMGSLSDWWQVFRVTQV